MRCLAPAAVLALLVACSPSGPPRDPREALVGRWGDVGNCAQPLQFNADGTFEYTGRAGRWTLENNHLTLSGAGGVSLAEIKWIDRDHMQLTRPDRTSGRSQRCPA